VGQSGQIEGLLECPEVVPSDVDLKNVVMISSDHKLLSHNGVDYRIFSVFDRSYDEDSRMIVESSSVKLPVLTKVDPVLNSFRNREWEWL